MNWFILAGTFLYLGGFVYELNKGLPYLGWMYLCYAFANVFAIMLSRSSNG